MENLEDHEQLLMLSACRRDMSSDGHEAGARSQSCRLCWKLVPYLEGGAFGWGWEKREGHFGLRVEIGKVCSKAGGQCSACTG